MSRPRIHKNNAAKQKAYRERKTKKQIGFVDRMQKVGDTAIKQHFGRQNG